MLARKTAMMCSDVLVADSFTEMSCYSLCKPARVDEDERCLVLANELGQSIVNLIPHLARHHSLQRRLRQLDCEVEFSRMTAVDDRAVRPVARRDVFSADEKARH